MADEELGRAETTEKKKDNGKSITSFLFGFVLFLGMNFLLFQVRSMIFVAWNTGELSQFSNLAESLGDLLFTLVYLFIDWGCIVFINFLTLSFLFVARFTWAGLGFMAGAMVAFFCWFTYGIFLYWIF